MVLLLAILGVLVAKPWGVPAPPGPAPTPAGASEAPPGSTLEPTAPEVPGTATPSATGPSTLDGGFTTPIPAAAGTPWVALRWRRLEHDPLALVTSAHRWEGGFIALGSVESGTPLTPVWTSTDGAHWSLLAFNTSTGFWPDARILGVVEAPGALVALTETGRNCAAAPCAPTYAPPAVAWTSPDGLAWTPHEALPAEWLASPAASPPLLAVGPAGMLAATRGPAARIATSTDGLDWRRLPTETLPARFWLSDLRGTPTGYVAAGRWTTGEDRRDAASMWSADGRRWSEDVTLLPTSPASGPDVGSAVASLVPGRDGLVAVGRGVTSPDNALWWQSSDGRRWQRLPTFGPLGSTTCTGTGCGLEPDGALAGDGQRLLAVRGGPGAGAWESADGRSWRPLEMTGEIPGGELTEATLLPGGILVSDGSSTWFGEALTH